MYTTTVFATELQLQLVSAPVKALSPTDIFSTVDTPLGGEAQRALTIFGELGARLNDALTTGEGLPSPEWERLAAIYSKTVTALLREARGYYMLRLDEERLGAGPLSPEEESGALVDAAVTLLSENEFAEVVRRRGVKR